MGHRQKACGDHLRLPEVQEPDDAIRCVPIRYIFCMGFSIVTLMLQVFDGMVAMVEIVLCCCEYWSHGDVVILTS